MEEKNSWNELSAEIIKILRRHERWWRMRIVMKSRLGAKDGTGLLIAIRERSSLGDISEFNIDNRIFVYLEIISNSSLLMPAPLHLHKEGEYLWVEADGVSDEQGNLFYQHACAVEVSPFYELNPDRQILQAIKTASSQLPKKEAGLVHIEIPYRDGDKILSVSDNLYETIHSQLKRNYGRVNAVILSAKRTNYTPRDPDDIVNTYYTIIPNLCPHVPLPPEFRIAGSSDGKTEFEQIFLTSGHEGTFLFELQNIPSIEEQFGRNICYFCSPDGQNQLRIWRDYRYKLVIELIKPQVGRKKIALEAKDFQNLVKAKIAISWEKKTMRAAINGELGHSE